MSERNDNIGKYGLIGVFVFVALGLAYGLWHDFTPEYEASVPIQYEMVVYDSKGNEMILGDTGHGRGQNYVVRADGKIVPLTKLNDEQMKIQEEDGCVACHEKK